VAVACPVVGEHALLRGGLDVLEPGSHTLVVIAHALGLGEGDSPFEDVERGASITSGQPHEMIERLLAEPDATVGAE
jgi:hypothetical protein